MGDLAVRVANLSKLYHIGRARQRHDTLRDALVDRLRRRRHAGHAQPVDPEDTIWALKDVSLEIKRGEVVGIIGRNGAGKSTLLKILSRITEPTRGRVELYGRVGSLLEVGTGFHPELTGRDNIYLNGAILGMRREEIARKFDEIVAFAEIEKFLDTPVKHYSSGMYVRLAFAVAAHLEPDILVVDEVLAVGDAAFQKKCLGKMGEVAGEGRTVLFVSHNMGAVRKLCSRAVMLAKGLMEIEGPTEAVVEHYLTSGTSTLSSIIPLPPGVPTAPGKGTVLRVLSVDGVPKAQFRLGERWRIALEFEMLRPMAHVIAAIGVVTLDAVGLITYWSRPADLTAGTYKVEFDFDVPLKSCDLGFVVGLSSYEHSFYYVSDIGHVAISDVATGDQPIRATGAGLLASPQVRDIIPWQEQLAKPVSGD